MSKTYNDMTLEELEKENINIGNERDALLNKQRELTKVIDLKLAEQSIQNKINNMSSDEIKAMYKALTQTVGVKPALTSNKGDNANG